MVDVVFVLVEGGADFRGVAIGAVHAVVPVAEVTRGRVKRGGLEVGILGHVGHLLAVVLQLTVVGALAVSAVTPRPEDEFRVGMVGQGGLEFARTVACVVVHLGQVLDELGLGFGVAAPPVFVGHAVRVVVLPVDVVLVDLTVAIVVPIVHRTVVHVVVGTVQFTL